MGYRVKYIYIYPFMQQLFGPIYIIIFDYIYIICIYTLIIHTIGFKKFYK